jgi:hypothetical protein
MSRPLSVRSWPQSHSFHQLRARYDALGAYRQCRQQAEFARGQFQRLVVDPHPMPGQVDAQAADAQVRVAIAGDQAQLGAHAASNSSSANGLTRVVVGTGSSTRTRSARPCGRSPPALEAITALAQALQHVAAIRLRQAQSPAPAVRTGSDQRSVGVRAIVDVVDHVPLPARRALVEAMSGRLQQSERAHARTCNGQAHRMDGRRPLGCRG